MLLTKVLILLLHCAFSTSSSSTHCTTTPDFTYHGMYVNCHGKGLTEIPQDFPANATSIDLNSNQIAVVSNYSFSSVDNLKFLNLENNHISRIENLAFIHSKELQELKLADNNMCYSGTVFDVFSNLRSLSIGGCYSGEIFKTQSKLQQIEITLDGELNFTGFDYLHQLKYIEIGGYTSFRNHTFNDLVNLRVEQLCIHSLIHSLEPGTFTPLPHIKKLSMIHTQKRLQSSLGSLYGLVGKNITTLEISKVMNLDALADVNEIEDRILKQSSMRYLLQICVKKLILTNNDIIYMDISALEKSLFGSCLTYLDISQNKFSHSTLDMYTNLHLLINLKYLNVSSQDRTPHRFTASSCSYKKPKATIEKVTVNSTSLTENGMNIQLPSFLQEANLSRIVTSLGEMDLKINFLNGISLLIMDWSYNAISYIAGFEGLDNLNYLDLSGNINLSLPDTFFDSLPSLETLKLNDGSLLQAAVDLQGTRFLKSLPKLTSLYIIGNHLIKLPPKLFERNPRLEFLDLSRNIFVSVPFDLFLTPQLHTLDMSYNTLVTLDSQTRNNLDKYSVQFNYTFYLNLHENYFSCSCENFLFLFWLNEAYLFQKEKQHLSCLTQAGHDVDIGRVNKNIIQFWRQCTGERILYVSVIIFTLLISVILLALLLFTNKTKLVHIVINALRYQIRILKRQNFRGRDVYISYAEADYQFVCHELCPALEERNLTLYIWDRDSLPGDSIPDQIAENMPLYWKTILYFTDNYERDPWSYMSMMTAINCVDSWNPERLVLLLPEGEYPRIPNRLLEVVSESCIIHFPADVRRNDSVWDEIEKLVKFSKVG